MTNISEDTTITQHKGKYALYFDVNFLLDLEEQLPEESEIKDLFRVFIDRKKIVRPSTESVVNINDTQQLNIKGVEVKTFKEPVRVVPPTPKPEPIVSEVSEKSDDQEDFEEPGEEIEKPTKKLTKKQKAKLLRDAKKNAT